jgi:hypothetical protein
MMIGARLTSWDRAVSSACEVSSAFMHYKFHLICCSVFLFKILVWNPTPKRQKAQSSRSSVRGNVPYPATVLYGRNIKVKEF